MKTIYELIPIETEFQKEYEITFFETGFQKTVIAANAEEVRKLAREMEQGFFTVDQVNRSAQIVRDHKQDQQFTFTFTFA